MSGTRVLCPNGRRKLCEDGARHKDCGGCKFRNGTVWLVTPHGITGCCALTFDGTHVQLANINTVINDVAFVVFPLITGDWETFYYSYTRNHFANSGDTTCTTQTSTTAGGMSVAVSVFGTDLSTNGFLFNRGRVFQTTGTTVSTSGSKTLANTPSACIAGLLDGAELLGVGGSVTVRAICTAPTLSSTSGSFTNAGGGGSFNVTTPAPTDEWFVGENSAAGGGGRVSVNDPSSFITITSATSFVGNDTVTFTVAANASGFARRAKIFCNSVTYTVNQAA